MIHRFVSRSYRKAAKAVSLNRTQAKALPRFLSLGNSIPVFLLCAVGWLTPARAQDPNYQLYILFGQSNMEGMAAIEAQDRVQNLRVKVLGYTNCTNLGRQYNIWDTASPPLHGCNVGLGPGDWFGKAMADSFPKATIGLVPAGISGVDIDYYRKGIVSKRRNEFSIPPDNHWSSAYDMMLDKAREAQKVGVIRGILLHQGESDKGDTAWVGKVRGIIADLRKDLGLSDSVPFLAGELLYNNMGGCCGDLHNPLIAKLPGVIPKTYVISANGLPGQDQAHFNTAGQRELGRRYAAKMAPLIRAQMTGVVSGRLPGTENGFSIRHQWTRNGLEVMSTSACTGFVLMRLDGSVVGRAAGPHWSIRETEFAPGIYFLRATGTGAENRVTSIYLQQ